MAKTSTLYPELNFGLSEGCIEAGLKISSLETLSKMDFNCNLDGFLELDYTQRLQKLPMHFPRFAFPHCTQDECSNRGTIQFKNGFILLDKADLIFLYEFGFLKCMYDLLQTLKGFEK